VVSRVRESPSGNVAGGNGNSIAQEGALSARETQEAPGNVCVARQAALHEAVSVARRHARGNA